MLSAAKQGHAIQMCHPSAAGDSGIATWETQLAHAMSAARTRFLCVCACHPSQEGGSGLPWKEAPVFQQKHPHVTTLRPPGPASTAQRGAWLCPGGRWGHTALVTDSGHHPTWQLPPGDSTCFNELSTGICAEELTARDNTCHFTTRKLSSEKYFIKKKNEMVLLIKINIILKYFLLHYLG